MLINFVDAFINFEKPLIAGVNGPAIGIGVTTLALCDLVLASSNSTFQCPFTKIGQSPEGTSSYSMPAILGPSGASELLLRLGWKLSIPGIWGVKLRLLALGARLGQRWKKLKPSKK